MKPICSIIKTKKGEIYVSPVFEIIICLETDMYNYHNTGITVCIDKAVNGILSGRLVCPILPHARHFTDVGNMLLQIEQILDTIGYPCAFQRLRSFNNQLPKYSKPNFAEKVIPILPEQKKGELMTVVVRVISRQNASWQGIAETEDGKRLKFESALTFLKLLVTEYEHVYADNTITETADKFQPMMA